MSRVNIQMFIRRTGERSFYVVAHTKRARDWMRDYFRLRNVRDKLSILSRADSNLTASQVWRDAYNGGLFPELIEPPYGKVPALRYRFEWPASVVRRWTPEARAKYMLEHPEQMARPKL